MAKKKLAIEAPSGDSAVETLVTGGSAVAGFLGGRLLRNKVPKANSKVAQSIIALVALTAHASVKGDGYDADAIRGVTLGLGVNQLAALGEGLGDRLLAQREQESSETMNGALDWAAAALTDKYVPASPTGAAGSIEVEKLIAEMSQNGPQDYALNHQPAAAPNADTALI